MSLQLNIVGTHAHGALGGARALSNNVIPEHDLLTTPVHGVVAAPIGPGECNVGPQCATGCGGYEVRTRELPRCLP
jgi:hypothetical protein